MALRTVSDRDLVSLSCIANLPSNFHIFLSIPISQTPTRMASWLCFSILGFFFPKVSNSSTFQPQNSSIGLKKHNQFHLVSGLTFDIIFCLGIFSYCCGKVQLVHNLMYKSTVMGNSGKQQLEAAGNIASKSKDEESNEGFYLAHFLFFIVHDLSTSNGVTQYVALPTPINLINIILLKAKARACFPSDTRSYQVGIEINHHIFLFCFR